MGTGKKPTGAESEEGERGTMSCMVEELSHSLYRAGSGARGSYW